MIASCAVDESTAAACIMQDSNPRALGCAVATCRTGHSIRLHGSQDINTAMGWDCMWPRLLHVSCRTGVHGFRLCWCV